MATLNRNSDVKKRIDDVLEQVIYSKNYEVIRELLSFEERKQLLFGNFGNSDEFSSLFFNSGIIYLNLFTPEEADQLYQFVDDEFKNDLLLSCSDDLKIAEREVYDGSRLLFIESFRDENKKLKAFELLLSDGYIHGNYIGQIIANFNSEMHFKLIDIICNCIRSHSQVEISLYSISSILSSCQEENRELFLNQLLKSLKDMPDNKKIDSYGLVAIINIFSQERKFDIFEKFVELKNNNKLDLSDDGLSNILKELEDSIKIDFLKEFLSIGIIKNNGIIPDIFEVFSDEMKDKVLTIFYEYDAEKTKKMINNSTIAGILMKYSKDKILDRFKRFVLEDDRYDDFEVINQMHSKDVRVCFSALNFKVKSVLLNLDSDEREKFFNIVSRQIEKFEDKVPNGEILYSSLIDLYVKALSLNRENLVIFIQRFGYGSLRYLDIENVRKAINLDREAFHKFMRLFKKENTELDNNAINDVVHSILQREFLFQCSDDYNIFSKLRYYINRSLLGKVQKMLLKISQVININKILDKYGINMEDFLTNLLNGKTEMLNILHEITNQYIMKKREEYVKSRLLKINDELDLTKKYEKNFIKRKYIATTSLFNICFAIRNKISDKELSQEQLELKNNWKVLESIINFKKSPNQCQLDPNYKKYLKTFDELLNILYMDDNLKDPTNDPNAKYVYFSKKIDDDYLLGIISELDMDNIERFLLSNEQLLQELSNILSKYKLLGWNHTFSSLEESADFKFSSSTLLGVINYFYKIYPEMMNDEDKKFSLTKFLSFANCYSSSSSKYSILFGKEVYQLLVANDGENKAAMVTGKRLKLGVEHIVGMYERENIPVPPLDVDVRLDNGKLINVVVGNVTDMKNLVLGECTESCSRIGGVFYDFYKECLEGEAGFHIVLLHPEMGKLISRVSGIRNGNTVFLNQLRDSLCDEYTNEECADVSRIVAKMLIEKSRESEFPIDNVVITADYAMSAYESELQPLNLTSITEALYGLSHNLSDSKVAIVLASSKEDHSLVEVNLGKDRISYYPPQRDKVRIYEGSDAVNRVVQLERLIAGVLDRIPLSEIDIELKQDIVSCISGSDWFISIDCNGNIQQFILDQSIDRNQALAEMSTYLEMLKNHSFEIERGVIKR